jgi:hypothetical protein
MRKMTLLLLLTFSFCSYGQTKNPFLSLKFDKVIIYDYQPHGENPSLVDNGQIIKAVTIKRQVELDRPTIEKLNAKLGDKKSYGSSHADCFEPHLGIVYYLQNKIVGNVIICLDCNLLSSSIDIPALKQGKQGQGKDTYYILDGLSKSFRQFLNDLLKKYNLSNQIKPGSMFDE